MADLLQLVVSGCATGAIYALAALGFTLLWQASGTINFAQGEFVMLPAFGMLFCIAAGAPPWLAFLITCAIAMLVLGWGFKRLIVDPLIRHGVIPLVIATLGLSIALKTFVRAGYSAEAHQFSSPFTAGQLSLAGINISYADIGTLLIAGLIVVEPAGVRHTHRDRPGDAGGRAEHRRRARARHRRQADGALHVPDQCGAGGRRGATGHADVSRQVRHGRLDRPEGVLRRDHRRLQPDPRRAASAALLIGVLENVVGFYVSPAYKEGVALMLFLIVILFRPEGLLGKAEERKV